MELKMKTEVLKDMVAKSIKGVGNDKLMPLTTKMAIRLRNNILTLITTDGTNYLYVSNNDVKGDDFYIVIESEQFSKLVSKMTSEDISIKLEDNYVTVKGNGIYKIEIPLDESTEEFITFPDPAEKLELKEEDCSSVSLATFKLVLESCKPSLATTYEDPQYTGYYVGEQVITTDRTTVAGLNRNLFGNTKCLVSPKFMELTNVLTADTVSVYTFDNNIVCATPNCSIYGKVMEGVEDFEVDTISELLNTEMSSTCSVNSQALLSVLDRICLFVGQYDNSAIKLSFEKDGLTVESMKSNGVEVIPYVGKADITPFTGYIDVVSFSQQVKAYNNETVTIEFGDDMAVKLVDADLTILVCLLDENEVNN